LVLRVLALSVTLPLAEHASATSLAPHRIDTFFVAADDSSELRWRVVAGELTEPIKYVIRDYWETPIAEGHATPTNDGMIQIHLQLAQGFFEVEFLATQQRFGVVALPAFSGTPDAFFCIDSAMSWLVKDDTTRNGLIHVLRRSGISMSRERFSWSQINPVGRDWQWESDSRYDLIRRRYAANGIPVLEMCHDAPSWMGRVGKYPDDLVEAAAAWRQIGLRWQATWGALEVWNEPDIFFGANLPADQYVTLVKTLAHSTGRATPVVPLVGGVVAHLNRPFLDNAAKNGLLSQIEAFSFHTYGKAPSMQTLVESYRLWLKAHRREAMPLWLTECGRPWPRGTDRPQEGPDQISALDITMKAVEARCCGVTRYFAFVYPFYEERDNNFGMMGRFATPLRSMAAYAYLTSVLSHKDYLGDLVCDDSSVLRCRVFGDDREAVAVLYRGQPDRSATVRLALPALRVAGLDGRSLQPADDGSIPIADGLVYVWLDRQKLRDHLATDTTAMRLWTTAKEPRPKRAAISPLLMRFEWDSGVFQAKSEGYHISGELPDKTPVAVRVFNLSDQRVDVTLRLKEAPLLAPLAEPQQISVPAFRSTIANWSLDVKKELDADGRLELIFTAANRDGHEVTRLVINLEGEPSLSQILQQHPDSTRLPITELARWQTNIAGHGKMTMDRTDDDHWQLQATFTESDRWVYPFFRLPESLDLTEAKGIAIRARCQEPATVRLFLWEGDTGIGYLTNRPIILADGRWHTALIRFDALSLSGANRPDANGRLDLDQVKRISVGLNSDSKENQLELADLYVY
jgi:hypothetical protein